MTVFSAANINKCTFMYGYMNKNFILHCK